jgi:hypothetical protein
VSELIDSMERQIQAARLLGYDYLARVMERAKTEVEHKDSEIRSLHNAAVDLQSKVGQLERLIEVKNAALRKIANHENYDMGGDPRGDSPHPMEIAQSALEQE